MARESLNAKQARLAKAFPGWHFWLSRGDRPTLMATRLAHITDDQVSEGLARCLPYGVGHHIDLEQQLREQTDLKARLDAAPGLLARATP